MRKYRKIDARPDLENYEMRIKVPKNLVRNLIEKELSKVWFDAKDIERRVSLLEKRVFR